MSINDINSLSHTKWNCKYHIVFAPKYRRKVFFGEKRVEIWSNEEWIEPVIDEQFNPDRTIVNYSVIESPSM